jgi:FtsH-binding integral membrane protein
MVNSSIYNTLFNKNQKKGGFLKALSILNEKKVFLLQVFGNLIFQLLVTFIIAFNVKSKLLENNINYWLLVALTFIIIICLALIPMPPILKFILFTLFSAGWGLLLTTIKERESEEVIKTALVGTLSIFFVMFLIGLFLLTFGIKFDYKVGGILLCILFITIITLIVMMFMKTYSLYHKSVACFILILFSFYIIYDTNIILQRDYIGDFITASLDYYLDILNIFINLVVYQN